MLAIQANAPKCLDLLVDGAASLRQLLHDVPISRVCTLGPEGTSSEQAMRAFVRHIKGKPECQLFNTYEEAAGMVITDKADFLIVANAYPGINHFYISNHLIAAGVFPMQTPQYGVAVRPDSGDFPKEFIAASHPATCHLARQWFHNSPHRIQLQDVSSTSEAAHMVAHGLAHACITTEIARARFKLSFVSPTIAINMLWTAFVRRDHVASRCLFGIHNDQ